jgi:transcriptional regulator with XRE-family HTH domain
MLMKRALEAAAPSLRELAKETGISYDTLRAWRIGRRNPEAHQLAVVADALERRGREQLELAKSLRRATS